MKRIARIILGLTLVVCLFSTVLEPVSAQRTSAQLPVLVTSIGQSPGPVYFRVFMNRLQFDFTFNSLATVADLEAGHETAGPYRAIILVTGSSGKGMGAAGISIEDELARARDLLSAARRLGIEVIGAHIEGMERRAQGAAPGDNTDEQTIDAVCPNADILLVLEEGDGDRRFTDIARSRNIPIVKFEKLTDLSSTLRDLFRN